MSSWPKAFMICGIVLILCGFFGYLAYLDKENVSKYNDVILEIAKEHPEYLGKTPDQIAELKAKEAETNRLIQKENEENAKLHAKINEVERLISTQPSQPATTQPSKSTADHKKESIDAVFGASIDLLL